MRVFLSLCALAAVYVSAAEYVGLHWLTPVSRAGGFARVAAIQPWGGFSWRRAAADAGAGRYHLSAARSDRILARAARRYPLGAQLWLDRARLALAKGEAADPHLALAVAIEPHDSEVLWEAAVIAVQAGNTRRATAYLHRWLRAVPPRRLPQSLLLASHWLAPGEVVQQLLPARDRYRLAALRFAFARGNTALGQALWTAAPARGIADPALHYFTELLLDAGLAERAASTWARRDKTYDAFSVPNGDFSRPLGAPLGLNWHGGQSAVAATRDQGVFWNPPASLRIAFDGSEPGAPALYLRLPARGGRTYELSGYWRADGIVSRAMPYLIVYSESGGTWGRVALPDNDFPWTRWRMRFYTAAGAQVLRLQLQRDVEGARDRYIRGTLWLDAIELQSAG